MKKTIKALLIMGSLGALCAGLAACSKATKVDEYFKAGNVISVTYDGSGGVISTGTNVSILDMFNPNKYTADEEGWVHIKLRDPCARKNAVGETIKIERIGYSLVGWYKTRNFVMEGKDVLDEEGNHLVEREGLYYKVILDEDGEPLLDKDGNKVEEEAIPAYTFADPWDFKKDTVDFKMGEERLDMTLYAAWVPEYKFEYYWQETENSEWKRYGTSSFDYIKSLSTDRNDPLNILDSVFIPQWSTGAEGTGKMEHTYGAFTFPSLDKMTFKAAYSDEGCQHEITRENPLQHAGSLDYDTAKPINPVQKVYVKFDKGSYYRISTAKQFVDIHDPDGYYTVYEDELDFAELSWPDALMGTTFKGRILSDSGNALTFKNVNANYQHSDGDLALGGLFGGIGEEAEIGNIAFENVVFDLKEITTSSDYSFGMLAGNIEKGATLGSITVGGELRIWKVSAFGSTKFNLITNFEEGVTAETKNKISNAGTLLKVCGEEQNDGTYAYSYVNPDTTTLDAEGNIILGEPSLDFDEQYKDQQFYIINGGDNND